MNRTLKTALIFVGAVALIFLLMHLETMFIKVQEWVNPQETVVTQMAKDIDDEWRAAGQWDQALFDRQLARLNNEYSKGNMKKRERRSLLTSVTESAWRVIDSVFNVQMADPNSKRSVVDANKKGLDYMSAFKDNRDGNEQLFKDSEHIKSSLSMYADYVRAMNFATKTLAVSPSIDGHFKWTPFSSTKSSWDNQKNTAAASPYFTSHFKNINVVKERWSHYEELVNTAHVNFNTQLSERLPRAVSEALTPIKNDAERERTNGNEVRDKYNDSNYATLKANEIEKLQAVYNRLDVFFNDATDALRRYGNEVGTGTAAYSQISEKNTTASKERMETKKVIDIL